ncbi:MAG: hypothetical protein O6952_05130 [Planctomycetota bacterium]|nr:hypothetical protein [Planctomycetota bacterium]
MSKRFETALVKVPAAYSLVRKHGVTRPGMLILDGDGKKVAFRKLKVGGGAQEALRLAKFLKKYAPTKSVRKKKAKPQRKKSGKRLEPAGTSKRGWY